MALPESPFEKRSKFQVIDGGLSETTKKVMQKQKLEASNANIYDSSLKLLAQDLKTFLEKHQ